MQLRHSLAPADNTRLAHLCGPLDAHLRTIEAAFHVTLHRRGERFRIDGARGTPQLVADLLDSLYARCDRALSAEMVQLAVASSLREASPVRQTSSRQASADDDIWSFTRPWETGWGHKEVRAGYTLMRDGAPVAYMWTIWRDAEDDTESVLRSESA